MNFQFDPEKPDGVAEDGTPYYNLDVHSMNTEEDITNMAKSVGAQNGQAFRSDFMQGFMMELGRRFAQQSVVAPQMMLTEHQVRSLMESALQMGETIFDIAEEVVFRIIAEKQNARNADTGEGVSSLQEGVD